MPIDIQPFITQQLDKKECTHPLGEAGECVCLIRCFFDYIGAPQFPAVVGAKDIWDVVDGNFFEKIPNTPDFIPQEGDVAILPAFPKNPYGHTCVVRNGATKNQYPSIDSNWSIPLRTTLETHTYSYIIGFLRKKQQDWSSVNVPLEFQQIWHRPGAKGEISYFLRRIQLGSIETVDDLRNKMQYWYGRVYPNGKYSFTGDIRWQAEKLLF